jgi:GT2 family glycosyltransferase/glycosyltransferase involved in cell wall biosynthesis
MVSPLSNNATIFSVPKFNEKNDIPPGFTLEKYSELIADCSNRAYPRVPTGGGFCMLIKRKVLNEIGHFDEIFGFGYGEENDLCERAKRKGYEIACADDAFVYHSGRASFTFLGNVDARRQKNREILTNRYPNYQNEIFEFCRRNPLRAIQERILIKTQFNNRNPHVLYVIHNYGVAGGTELHTTNILEGLSGEFRSTVLFPYSLEREFKDAVSKIENDSLRVIGNAKENNLAVEYFINYPGDLTSPLIEENFSRILLGGDYQIIFFQHLLEWSSLLLPIIAKKLGKKVILSLRDFYLLCPEYNMIFPGNNERCGKDFADWNDNECVYCLSAKRIRRKPRNPQPIQEYMQQRFELIRYMFTQVDVVIAHSQFVKEKFLKTYGDVLKDKLIVISHGVENLPAISYKKHKTKLNVGFIGNASSRKGVLVLIEAARLLQNKNITFKIFGKVPPSLIERCNEAGIILHGEYQRKELPSLFKNIHIAVIPSIWDETFSHTLSETFKMTIPVLASKVGALNERITEGETGFMFEPNNPNDLVEKLLYLQNNPNVLEKVHKNLITMNLKSMGENVDNYRKLYNKLLHTETEDISEIDESYLGSIIVPTFNGLEYTKQFYDSLKNLRGIKLRINFIDNNSSDGTKEFLQQISRADKNVNVVLNSTNYGFPKAINQGIKIAEGKYILIANNDIVITKNSIKRMIEISESDEKIGIVGPISNIVSGMQHDKEAKYDSIEEMHKYAERISEKNKGQVQQFPRVAFLCTLIKREVIEKIGGLDERFSPGNFEDDDFCLRAQLAGYKTVIAKDVFIHHYGSKSFKANGEKAYAERMQINQKKFVNKWGADPNEIWLKGKQIKQRGITYPIDSSIFIESFTRALNHSEDNELDFALLEAERAIEHFNNCDRDGFEKIEKIDVINLTANLALQIGNLEKAKDYFKTELELDPNSSRACLGLAETFFAADLFQEAKTMYEWAIKNGDNRKEIWDKLAIANTKLELDPKNFTLDLSSVEPSPTLQDAEELINKSDLAGAEKILMHLLEKDNQAIDVLNDLAVIKIMQNNLEEALNYINKVIKNDPQNEIAIENLKYIEAQVTP